MAKFNERNDLDLFARAHKPVMEGRRPIFKDALVTVWCARNYCYRCGKFRGVGTNNIRFLSWRASV